MSKKMTISELRAFIQTEAMKLYAKHLMENRLKVIKENLDTLENKNDKNKSS